MTSGSEPAMRSDLVPDFATDADRDAFRAEILDEWETVAKLGELRPVSGGRPSR